MILNHLWQSSLFVVAVWVLTLVLRTNRAAVRYWLWLAASVKFLIPFSLLVSLGGQFGWRTGAPVVYQPQVSFVMEEISRVSVAPVVAVAASPGFSLMPILVGIWVVGILVGVILWGRSWLRIRAAVRAAARKRGQVGDLSYLVSSMRMEPGVFGIFRPVLLLPEGIMERLTSAQLEAIIAHELCHVRRRDNLTGAIHMVVETIFWFHPLVWWIRARLIDERERACDEEVLRMGSAAEVYAESILEACKLYLESPLACVSGVTGSDLRKRIEAIMANRHALRVNFSKKVLLAIAAMGAVMGPIAVGVLNAPRSWAQSSSGLAFEVASVKQNKSGSARDSSMILPGGRFTATNNTVRSLILNAYGIFMTPSMLSGGPSWIDSERYDVEAKAAEDAIPKGASGNELWDKTRLMLRALLAERFHLVVRRETKEMPVYDLVVAKNGLKLPKSELDCGANERACHGFAGGPRLLSGTGVGMSDVALMLSRYTDRPVQDKTGVQGIFDLKLQWNPFAGQPRPNAEAPQSPGAESREGARVDLDSLPTLFEALDQIGLKLEPRKAPVDGYVIERVERPSGNEQALFRKAMWTPEQAFEVASVKPSRSGAGERSLNTKAGGRLSTSNATVKQLVYFAYNMLPFQVVGGPDWVGSQGFDIEAKPADPKASREQVRQMVQKLLAERFQLKAHMETKELPVFALVVGKRGSKLVEDHSEDTAVEMTNNKGEMTGVKATMPMFASALTVALKQQVVDETGLKGAYSFQLQFVPDKKPPSPDEVEARPDRDGTSLFTALQEQLGLSLKAAKGPVGVLVIDSAERPAGN